MVPGAMILEIWRMGMSAHGETRLYSIDGLTSAFDGKAECVPAPPSRPCRILEKTWWRITIGYPATPFPIT